VRRSPHRRAHAHDHRASDALLRDGDVLVVNNTRSLPPDCWAIGSRAAALSSVCSSAAWRMTSCLPQPVRGALAR
jgi:hypothetical protein